MKKKIVVDLSDRTLKAYEGDKVIYNFTVLVGRSGHATTVGKYKILWKHKDHKSRKYNSAPMNFAMFFDDDGKAIHESANFGVRNVGIKVLGWTGLTNNLATHGCVGLSHSNAEKLWDWAPKGTPVIIEQ